MNNPVPPLLERELDYHFFSSMYRSVSGRDPKYHRTRARALARTIRQIIDVVTPRSVVCAGTPWAPWRTRVDPNRWPEGRVFKLRRLAQIVPVDRALTHLKRCEGRLDTSKVGSYRWYCAKVAAIRASLLLMWVQERTVSKPAARL